MSNNVSVPKNFLFFSIISSFSSMLLPCCFFLLIFLYLSFFLSSYYYLLPPPPIIIFFFLLVVVVFFIYYIHTTTTVFTTCTILHCYFIRNKRFTASTDWGAGSIFLDRIQVISFSWAMVIVLNTPPPATVSFVRRPRCALENLWYTFSMAEYAVDLHSIAFSSFIGTLR